MNIVVYILGIYAIIDLITSITSLLGRRRFLKTFSPEYNNQNNEYINPNNDLQLLEMSLFIKRTDYMKKIEFDETKKDELKQTLSLIKKIKSNEILSLTDKAFIEEIKNNIKKKLTDLIRLDSTKILINVLIIFFIMYFF